MTGVGGAEDGTFFGAALEGDGETLSPDRLGALLCVRLGT